MNIIVTGCSSGIGKELVFNLCSKKHKVVGIARNEAKLAEIEKEIGTEYFKAVPFDITQIKNSENEFKNSVLSFLPTIDIIINNAGYLAKNSFETTNTNDIMAMFQVNVFAPAEIIKVFFPYLNKTKSHVVNIGSMAGFQGSSKFPGISWYSSSKAAIAALTECLAVELKEKNVFVNCLALGSVQTEMLNKAFPGLKAPLLPAQMAEFIADFAISGSNVFNGKVLPVALSNP